MKLRTLSLKNIRSYKSQEIVFPLGSTLLSGDVGAGKTTILLAIEYALFGLQPGQRGSALLSSSENEGSIVLELDLDGNDVVIERTLKRTPKGINQESVFLTLNNERHELSVTELKTRILQLLNYPEEFIKKTNLLYRYTVYSPQEEMKQIIVENEESRLNILRHIFGIDKYKKIKENLLIVTANLREKSRILQAEIKDIEEQKSKIQSSISSLETIDQKIEDAEKSVYHARMKRKECENELKELDLRLTEKRNFEKEIEKANVVRANKIQNLSDYEKQIKRITDSFADIQQPESQDKYEELVQRIAALKKDIDKGQSELIEITTRIKSILIRKDEDLEKRKRVFSMEICPTCLQDVSENHKHNILNETESHINKNEREIELFSHTSQVLKDKIESLKKELENAEKIRSSIEIVQIKYQEHSKSQSRLHELIALVESLKKDISSLESHLSLLKQSVFEFSKFETLHRVKAEELKLAFNDEKKFEIANAEIKKEREFLVRDKTRMQSELEKKEKARDHLARVLEMEKWLSEDFTGLISITERNILLKVREEFSRLFNKWFGMLTTDSFYVQLDENFTPIVVQGDYELDYEFLSGGERTAVALAYRLALNQIINSLHSKIKTRDIIILDEPTDGFSEAQLDKVRDILKEINVAQLVIVSHEQKIESFVDNIIKIKKENGHSVKE